jgi:transcription antitermination protein NusB
MITRRNIRIKVMQLLYSIETTKDNTAFKNPVSTLQKNLDKTRELFVYLVANTLAIAQYAEKDAKYKAAKYVPSEEDLNINTKISGNQVLWSIVEAPSYINSVAEFKTNLQVEEDIVKRHYEMLVITDEYKNYINNLSREKKEDVSILKYIFNDLLLPSDVFTSLLEEKFANWDDDADMMLSLVNSYFQKQQNISDRDMLDADKWGFAKDLLNTCIEKGAYLQSLASPKFKNWDADRIATLDMIIIKMGLSEFLYFETIPTKVTLNEYIDLAKEYSTEQSGQFINGLLDSMQKDFIAAGKINKVDFRKK